MEVHANCIIIPCYNEEKRLEKDMLLLFIKQNKQFHFCFVNDGSKDKTLQLLNEIKNAGKDNILVIDQPVNSGKAEAVRRGMQESYKWKEFQNFAYFDADFATPLTEVATLLEVIKNKKIKFVLGSRVKRLGATVERSLFRHYFGRVFATFASIILDIPVYDTQCGAKIISREWVEIAFNKPFISSWLFDVEILARLRNHYGKTKLLEQTMEAPLNTWVEKGGSKIKLIHLIKVPIELLRIHLIYNQKVK